MTTPPESLAAQLSAPESEALARSGLRRWLRRPVAMVTVAFLLRLAILTLGHSYKLNPRADHFGFGWETGRIARSIAEGGGFSSPFVVLTGPTAWVAPAYPYLVAGVFRIFGVYSYGSAWILLALNSLFSALTCWTLYGIAQETVGLHPVEPKPGSPGTPDLHPVEPRPGSPGTPDLRVARWAGWTWALLPYSIYWAIRWVWETSLSAFLLSLAFLLALRLARAGQEVRWQHWTGAAALWSLIALTNPSLLSFLPAAFLWPALKLYRAGRISLLRGICVLVLSAAVFLVGIAPWLARNYRTFGEFVFIRSNLGAELRMGNSPQANGLWMDYLHPTQNPTEMAKYQRMGELGYVHERKQEALEFIRSNPRRFLWLCWRRFLFYWMDTPRPSQSSLLAGGRHALFLLSSLLMLAGLCLMVRNRIRGAWLFAALMALYPAVYYITFPHPRYRHPMEPEMLICGLYLLAQAVPARRQAQPCLSG